jgi:hypothetical protein
VLIGCGAPQTVSVVADRATATADGVDAVTITATASPAQFVDFTVSAGGQLTETRVKSDASGKAITKLTSSSAGMMTVTASVSMASASTTVTFSASTAPRLRFQTSPANTLAMNLLRPVPVVIVEDGAGIVTSSSAAITVAITPGSCAATLDASSLLTVNAAMGSASFYGLKSSIVATGCTLTATSGSLQAASSTVFDIR